MEPWHYEQAQDLDQSLVERLRRFPRQPDLTIYALRTLAALVVRAWLRIYHRFEISGHEHLPSNGSFVMVANHTSHLDALCLLSALPLRKLHRAFPAAAQDYFFAALPRLAIAAIVVNALPLARQTHVRQSLDLCRQLLTNPGNILILFPEGTRSSTGQIGEFRTGIGMLVAGTNVPVVPCYIDGASKAWHKGVRLPRPRKVRLRIGEPQTFFNTPLAKGAAEHIAEELRLAVLSLAK